MDEAVRLAREQSFSCRLEDELDESEGGFLAEQVVEPVAQMDRGCSRSLDRTPNQAGTTELEEPTMSRVGIGSSAQQSQPLLALEKSAELFARTVPIDEEDEPRA